MILEKKHYRPNFIVTILIVGLIAFIVYLSFFVDLEQITKTLLTTNLVIYSLAFGSYILYTICSSLAWHDLLVNLGVKINLRKALQLTWAGLFFDATLPQLGWSAEVSKTYMLSKDSNTDSGRIGASVVGQKIITMTITIVALSLGLCQLLLRYSFPIFETILIAFVLISSILTLALVYYISLKPSATKALLNLIIKIATFFRKKWNSQNFKLKVEELLKGFHTGIKWLKDKPIALVKPIVFTVLGFMFEVSVLFIAFAALGQIISFDVVLIVFTLTGILQTIGVAFFGFPELIMSITLAQLGIAPSTAVSVAILTRLVNLWFRLIVSYSILQWTGIKLLKEKKTSSIVH